MSQTNQNKQLQQRLPNGDSFLFFDTSVSTHPKTSVIEMREEDNVRHGWMLHPQIGFQPKESMIDVGAGFGSYTLTALTLEAKHVYAFERNPELVRCLRENLRINGDYYRIHCSVINKTVSPLGIQLDDFIFNQLSVPPERLNWIKVDVGGQDELNIIMGARKIVETYRPMRIMIHHYSGIEGYDKYVDAFLHANSFESVTIPLPIKGKNLDESNELFSTTFIK